ncbi:MAG: glycine cleavage system protein GcvH [Pseudomonadota bacterium]
MTTTLYTKDHEWVRIEGDLAVVGITPYAAEQLGDVVYVELPEIGRSVDQFKEIAVVESVKAASEVYAPLAGEVVEVNEPLNDNPGAVNEAPDGDGWFVKLKVTDPSQTSALMDEAAYKTFVDGLN